MNMVRWAVLNIPFQRRLQTLSVGFVLLLPLCLALSNFFVILFPVLLLPLFILYLIWVFNCRTLAGENLPQPSTWLRSLTFWRRFREYFPAELQFANPQAFDLDQVTLSNGKQQTFVFAAHPHGIFGLSIWGNFIPLTYSAPQTLLCDDNNGKHEAAKQDTRAGSSAGTDDSLNPTFGKRFPHLQFRVGTLALNFYIPVYREYVLACGFVDVSKETLVRTLVKHNTSVVIVVGGAAEALYAKPGASHLVLSKRMGYVHDLLKTHTHTHTHTHNFREREREGGRDKS